MSGAHPVEGPREMEPGQDVGRRVREVKSAQSGCHARVRTRANPGQAQLTLTNRN
jgi:hypothetical protein